jgi:fructose transport system permease protein
MPQVHGSREPHQSAALAELAEAGRLATSVEGEIVDAEVPRGFTSRLQHALHNQPLIGPAVVVVAAFLFFALWVGSRFYDPLNLSLIVQQVQIVGMLGIAQTLIILTAGIDLSVGAIMVLSSVVMGKTAVDSGVPVPLALALGLMVGTACGGLNGVLVTRFRIPPFIATLGTLNVFYAINLYYSKSQTIRSQEVPALLKWPGESFGVLGTEVTYGSVLMLVCFAVIGYMLRRTAWGEHVYASGDNPEGARLSGIRTDRVLMSVYLMAGLFCALAGWFLIGRIGSVSPQAGASANLDSITAVVIGGTSLFGGRGNVLGTLLGALIVGIFSNGLALAGVDVLWQVFTIGILIIVAVGLDQWLRKVAS